MRKRHDSRATADAVSKLKTARAPDLPAAVINELWAAGVDTSDPKAVRAALADLAANTDAADDIAAIGIDDDNIGDVSSQAHDLT